MLKLIYIFLLSFLFTDAFSQTIHPGYEDGSIYFKIKDAINLKYLPVQDAVNLDDMPFLENIRKQFKINELHTPFYIAGSTTLKKTFKILFSDPLDVDKIINALYQTGFIEYAEKVPLLLPTYTTNDPSYSKQWSLTKINATKAWDYSKGNKKIVVAVVDNAVDINHPDLKANIWINPKEIAGNGKDDDNNGYVDDVNGWDAADNDNDPTPAENSVAHGTHCAGIVGAVADNNTGISSLSFGIRIMAVKANKSVGANSSSDIFKGITYAADAGAKVISLSWSSSGSSQTDQNIINYAYGKGAIIVVAAGNNNSETKTYPAAYPNVISVASSDESDKKSSFSSYGTWVDITAPGNNIYSTVPGNGYQSMSGTSMACPLVASLCGLMLSLNPSLTQTQLENCLKSSSTPIDAANPGYAGKLGAGRINAEAAMKCVASTTNSMEGTTYENSVIVYPNPANRKLFIELSDKQAATLQMELVDLTGQKIMSIPPETIAGYSPKEVDISWFPPGIYFLYLKLNEQLFIKKIVKTNE
jgi:serine protease